MTPAHLGTVYGKRSCSSKLSRAGRQTRSHMLERRCRGLATSGVPTRSITTKSTPSISIVLAHGMIATRLAISIRRTHLAGLPHCSHRLRGTRPGQWEQTSTPRQTRPQHTSCRTAPLFTPTQRNQTWPVGADLDTQADQTPAHIWQDCPLFTT